MSFLTLKNFALLAGNLLQLFLFLNGLFYLFISFSALAAMAIRKTSKPGGKKKFALLVPAHNEESVIGYFLESAARLNYPENLRDIYIISDHSTDRTAQIARSFRVKVLEFSEENRPAGKAAALNRAAAEISGKDYDAYCYFDADSLVHPEFLNRIANLLETGAEAIQGRQISKNPREGWLARILSVGQLISNRFFQKPKSMLGLPATFHGKGICLKKELAEKYPWDETCLTEDLEMQMRLIRSGVKLHWCEDAVVYDEQPLTFRQYFKRTIRWTRGSLDTAKKHLGGLFGRFFRTGDLCALEGALYCGNVYRLSLISLTAGLMYLNRDGFNILVAFYHALPGAELSVKMFFILPVFFIPFITLCADRISPDLLLAYFFQPALGVLRIPTFIAGIFKNKINWDRTDHSSRVAISDIIK